MLRDSRLGWVLFNVIRNNYKSNKYLWKSVHDEVRYKIYGSIGSYDGNGQSDNFSKILAEYIKSENIFNNVKTYHHKKNIYDAMELRLSCHDHTFLKVYNIYNERLIIDATYKQLFINKRGPVQKMLSPYADTLYNLPPIFIGTPDVLSELICYLEKIKQQDALHSNDTFITDWHSNIQ